MRRSMCIALALAAAVAVHAGDASAFAAKHTKGGRPVRWTKPSVELVVSPSVNAVPGADVAIMRALVGWSGVGGAPEVTVRIGDGSEKVRNDGVNVIVFSTDEDGIAGDALAVTALSYDTTTGEIVDADIVVNGTYPFALLRDDAIAPPGAQAVATEGGGYAKGRFDIVHVVAHEAGHTLGLADEPLLTSALMYGFTMPDDASRRAPTADDLNGLSSQYSGANLSATHAHGCASATVAGRRPEVPFGLFAVATVILPILRRARRDAERHSGGRHE